MNIVKILTNNQTLIKAQLRINVIFHQKPHRIGKGLAIMLIYE